MTALAPLLQAFFTDRLAAQRHASPHTVLSYRDAFRLLLDYAANTTGKTPSALDIADLDAGADRVVPRPPRTRPAQQRPHPQQQAGRDPFTVQLRRAAPP
jgi:hypothetical protein